MNNERKHQRLPGTAKPSGPPQRKKATPTYPPVPPGSFTVVPNTAPTVTQNIYDAMTQVIAVLTAAAPNVVRNSDLYSQLDGLILSQGDTDLVQVLNILQNVGAVKFCSLTATWYLPFSGSQPLSSLVKIATTS
jgi:hypothetical protein